MNAWWLRACGVLALCIAAAACAPKSPTPPASVSNPARPATPPPPPAAPQAVGHEAYVSSLAPDHARIRYRVYGRGQPTLVFIHCWSCNSGYWDTQLNHFAQKYTVVTLDLAGHGKSATERRKDWSIANFGADVAAVVGAVGAPRVVLVGHSMGGPVALEAAARLQGKVIGIVGVDTLREIAHPYPREVTDRMLADLRKDFPSATAGFVGSMFTPHSDPIVKRWIVKDMSGASPKVGIASFEALVGYDARAAVAHIDVPIVAINAAEPPTDVAAIRQYEPRFGVVTLPEVGHFLMIERPGQFNAALGAVVRTWAALEPPGAKTLASPRPTR